MVSGNKQDLFGVFAKYWEPGKVKTRLASEIGAVEAATIYRSFIEVLLTRLGTAIDRRLVAFSPPESIAAFQLIVPERWEVVPQIGENLGERMANFFVDRFREGASKVVLVGSDSPNLPPEFVDQAFDELDRQPIVIGPTDDGGYYLIGMNRPVTQVFDCIQWSTPQVLTQTLQRLDQLGCGFGLLTPWFDVDTRDDLRRLVEEIRDTELDQATDPLKRSLISTGMVNH